MFNEEWWENPLIWWVGIIVSITGIVMLVCWLCAGVECRLYNQAFGTTYTQKEFFFAGDTIKLFINPGKQHTIHLKTE